MTLDSRLKYGGRMHPTLPLERTFCINCGAEKGWVSSETYDYIRVNNVIVICDVCHEKLGKLQLPEANIKEM